MVSRKGEAGQNINPMGGISRARVPREALLLQYLEYEARGQGRDAGSDRAFDPSGRGDVGIICVCVTQRRLLNTPWSNLLGLAENCRHQDQ